MLLYRRHLVLVISVVNLEYKTEYFLANKPHKSSNNKLFWQQKDNVLDNSVLALLVAYLFCKYCVSKFWGKKKNPESSSQGKHACYTTSLVTCI